MPDIELPDGKKISFSKKIDGFEIANKISKSLIKDACIMSVDGELKDLSFVKNIENSGSVSHGVAISPDSKYAFVSLEGVGGEPGIVDVISLKNLKVISSVKVGKQAGGIAFWKTED